MAGLQDLVVSTREGYLSTSQSVGAVSNSTQEGSAVVGELIGYGEIFHDRTAYGSVMEAVAVGAISTREGYAYVGELLGYDDVYHERTAYATVETAVTFRLPDFDEVQLDVMGWGVPLQSAQVLTILHGASEGTSSVCEAVVFDAHPVGDTASASVDSYVVSSL